MKKIINLFELLFLLIGTTSFAQKSTVLFDTTQITPSISWNFPDTSNHLYLRQLRTDYALSTLLEGRKSDVEKVLSVLNWTHQQWKHNGSNMPSKSDALTILKEAKNGKKFRCVEYGIVSSSALLALNYKARVLGLCTKKVETAKFSAGHVLAEVWLPEFNKWALIDGQYNIMPVLNGVPLNAAEFQSAIAQKKKFKLVDINGTVSKWRRFLYLRFIRRYLYYFNVGFGEGSNINEKQKSIDGKTTLYLVPIGAKNPTVFQRKFPIKNALYTNSTKDFYKKP
ncbi:MAG: hypothetical protein RIR11_4661 [Bacteroidota bacterium]|jgi:hypothetical protein